MTEKSLLLKSNFSRILFSSTFVFLFLILQASVAKAQTTHNAGTYAELTTAIANAASSGDIINITNNIVVTSNIINRPG
ncbi:MAG TPA: hypothetical protein VIK89_09480 [Cytophagaceae bacterium]|jgi:hypothetical protein